MSKNKKIRVVTYDIETGLSKFVGFRPGKQYVSPKQLLKGFLITPIICLSYSINDSAPQTIVYDLSTANCKKMIEEFDKIIQSADVVIGKNNFRFDDKHLNYHRMLNDLDGVPNWLGHSDDVESQMRRFFFMPSYSLDHFSEVLGLGGKVKMDMSDWLDILILQTIEGMRSRMKIAKMAMSAINKALEAYVNLEYNITLAQALKNGYIALKKMIFYNKKDVKDTRTIWKYCVKHFKPKFNMAANKEDNTVCVNCGSKNIHKNGTRVLGKTRYQHYFCKEHMGYAGKRAISFSGNLGKPGL